jgi:hypothetical protein
MCYRITAEITCVIKKHIHQEKSSHSHSKAHQEKEGHNPQESENKKDNCCNDEVAQLAKVYKSVPLSLTIVHPIFLNTFFGAFYSVIFPPDIGKDIKQFIRSYHPPIANIPIVIQSFQI